MTASPRHHNRDYELKSVTQLITRGSTSRLISHVLLMYLLASRNWHYQLHYPEVDKTAGWYSNWRLGDSFRGS